MSSLKEDAEELKAVLMQREEKRLVLIERNIAEAETTGIDLKSGDREIVLKGQIATGKKCPPGYEYCWECGHIAPKEEFTKADRCPNPNCPRPWNWND